MGPFIGRWARVNVHIQPYLPLSRMKVSLDAPDHRRQSRAPQKRCPRPGWRRTRPGARATDTERPIHRPRLASCRASIFLPRGAMVSRLSELPTPPGTSGPGELPRDSCSVSNEVIKHRSLWATGSKVRLTLNRPRRLRLLSATPVAIGAGGARWCRSRSHVRGFRILLRREFEPDRKTIVVAGAPPCRAAIDHD